MNSPDILEKRRKNMTYANEYIGEIEIKSKEDEEKKTKERLEKYKELMDEIKEKEEEEE